MTRGTCLWLGAAAVFAAMGSEPALARRRPNVSIRGDSPAADCRALHITFDGRDAIVRTEERTVTRAEAPTLRVEADPNGGLQVQGWDRDTYSVALCKAAAAGSAAEGRLDQVKLSLTGGVLTVAGSSHDEDLTTFLLIHAPKAAALDMRVKNGPMSLYDTEGKVVGRAENGPVSARGCKGELDLAAENGPVSSEDNTGSLRLRSENGPIDVSLQGDSWIGSGLDAHTENGPLTLRLPEGYKSGVVVEADGGGPFRCHASACTGARRTWSEDHKRIEFGAGPAKVHLSVVNGPVSVD